MEIEEEQALHSRNKDPAPVVAVDEEGEELLDINPMKKTWTICKNEVVTYVEHETSPVLYLFVLLSMFLFGWMFVFLAPFAYLLLKNAVHRCSRWLNEIGTRHMFGIPDFSQEILVFQLGKCSVIISRTVGFIIFGSFAIVFLYFSWFYDFGVTDESALMDKQSFQIASTWDEFLEDCGSNVIISNNLKAKEIFKHKYQNNVVNWEGYFVRILKVESFSFIQNNHAFNILVKMDPSESEIEPDIVLTLSENTYEMNKDIIEALYTGDQITFSAKFIEIGDEQNINHLHSLSIAKTGKFKELPEITVVESFLPESVPAHADKLPTGSS